MSVNSSSNSSLDPEVPCIDSDASISLSACIITKSVVLLPLSILIFYLGYQRWRKQRSFATTSHSEIFTFHMVAMELIGSVGSPFFFCGGYFKLPGMMKVTFSLCINTFFGETLFHLLTCVERYLAVVHPVTYMGLKQAGGVRIRNISIGCVWLSAFGLSAVATLDYPKLPIIPYSCILIFSFIVVSFCSFSALCVLIRPGPGKVGREREQVDRSKQRAFHTITAIMGALWLSIVGCLVTIVLATSTLLNPSERCALGMSGLWFNLPSSLVLPLLFLHRAGKLPFCNSNGN